jgi:hypothetical protein
LLFGTKQTGGRVARIVLTGQVMPRGTPMAWRCFLGTWGICLVLTCCGLRAGEDQSQPPSSLPILPDAARASVAQVDPTVECALAPSAGDSICPTLRRPGSRFVPTMMGDLIGFNGGVFGFGGGQFTGAFGGQFGQFQGAFGGQFGQFQGGFGQFGQFGQFQGGFGQFGQFGQFNLGAFGGQFGGQFGAPIAVARGAFKAAENESPLPQDRIFVGYNYYNNVKKVADVHREVAGFEKTFIDGGASVGVRLPYYQIDGPADTSDQEIDDLSVVFKGALLRDPNSLSAFSVGLVVTAPTGPTGFTPSGLRTHPTLIQPFAGYLWDAGNLYVIGFTSLMTTTERRDSAILFNDIGVGYWLYRASDDRPLAGVVPTVEAHVNTPMTHRSEQDPNRYSDSFNLTTGCHFVLRGGSSLSVGVCTPLTGPKLFDFEAITQLNWRF